MKKLISIGLILALLLTMGAAALAAEEPEGPGPTDVITELGGTSQRDVLVTVIGGRQCYEDDVTDGSGDISVPGFEAHVSGDIPEGAVRLVIVPISDPDSLEWFDGCVGEPWSSTGTIYAVFYEDAEGNFLGPASGVEMTVPAEGGYENLTVYAVGTDESAAPLDYTETEGSVRYTTDGRLYSGVVHRRGELEEEVQVGPGAPETVVDMSPEELADAVLTEEDKEYLEQGVDVDIILTVDDITNSVPPAEAHAVESIAGDYTIGQYIDVELLKHVGDQPWFNVHETNRPVRITVTISPRLLGPESREFAMVRVHDGTASYLDDLDSAPETFTFETTQFSTYAILYRDPVPATPSPSPTPGESPKTGDESPLAALAALQLLSLAGLALVWKKRKA